MGFNSRTRKGCDIDVGKIDAIVLGVSIHAPVKGATLRDSQHYPTGTRFNSRTRKGCDLSVHRRQ